MNGYDKYDLSHCSQGPLVRTEIARSHLVDKTLCALSVIQSTLAGVTAAQSTFEGARFVESHLERSDFTCVSFRNAYFKDTLITDCTFQATRFVRCTFDNCRFVEVRSVSSQNSLIFEDCLFLEGTGELSALFQDKAITFIDCTLQALAIPKELRQTQRILSPSVVTTKHSAPLPVATQAPATAAPVKVEQATRFDKLEM